MNDSANTSGTGQPAGDAKADKGKARPAGDPASPVPEVGGRGGPDPTRYGDWEINGRCIDF